MSPPSNTRGLPSEIGSNEELGRATFSSRHFRANAPQAIRFDAFLEKTGEQELSLDRLTCTR